MVSDDDVAPAVRSILETARNRGGGEDRVSVDARSLRRAIDEMDRSDRVPILAEIKPTSPTTEGTRRDDPVELATEMVAGGATALSVLTEPEYFGGRPSDLERVRDAVDVPVLRKDFLLREEHLDAVPADVVLLIARFVDDLDGMVKAARDRGFQVLVEVHTRREVDEAVSAGATYIGINNRDLARLEVDLGTFERVVPSVPDDAVTIAESGISRGEDVRRMRRAGADALLVGSAIMDGDVRANTRRLVSSEEGQVSTGDGHSAGPSTGDGHSSDQS